MSSSSTARRARQLYTDREQYKRLSRSADDAVAQLVLEARDGGASVAKEWTRFKSVRSKFENTRAYLQPDGRALKNIEDDRAVVLRLATDNVIRRALQGQGRGRRGGVARAIREGANAYAVALDQLRDGRSYADLYDHLVEADEDEAADLLEYAAGVMRVAGQRRAASASGDTARKKRPRQSEAATPDNVDDPPSTLGKRRERESDTEANDGVKRSALEPEAEPPVLDVVAPVEPVVPVEPVAPLAVPGPGGAMPVVSTLDRADEVPVPDLPGRTAAVEVPVGGAVDPEITGTVDDARDELAGDAPEVDVARLTADVVADQVKESAVYVSPEQQAALLDQAGAALLAAAPTTQPTATEPASMVQRAKRGRKAQVPGPTSVSTAPAPAPHATPAPAATAATTQPQDDKIDKLVNLMEIQTELLSKLGKQQHPQQQPQRKQDNNTSRAESTVMEGITPGPREPAAPREAMAGVRTQREADREAAEAAAAQRRQERQDRQRPVAMEYTRTPGPEPSPDDPMMVDRPGEVFGVQPQLQEPALPAGSVQTALGVYDPAYSAQDRKRAIEIEARRQREAKYYEQNLPGKVFSLKKTVAARDLTSMYSAIDTKIVATRNCIARAVGIATDTSEDTTLEPTEFGPFRENMATGEPGERGSSVRGALAAVTKSASAARAWDQWSRVADMYFSKNNRIKYGPIVAEASQALVVALSGLAKDSAFGAYAGKVVSELQILAATCRGVSYFTKMRDMAGTAVETLT